MAFYNSLLQKHPLLTKMATTGFLSGTGDFICQKIDGNKNWDIRRTFIFTSMGVCYIAPLLHFNYSRFLPLMVPDKGSASLVAFKKLCLDQFGFAPVCTAGFFMLINLVEGKGVQGGIQDMDSKFKEAMIVNWKLWIPANFANFYFIPNMYQVLFANCVSLVYNVCLSAIYNKK